MKVLITVPQNRPQVRDLPASLQYPCTNDIGLGSIAAACKDTGAEVTLFSWNKNYHFDEFKKLLHTYSPDIVGMKVFTTQFVDVYNTLQVVREALPSAAIIIGGPHPSTSKPEDIFLEFGNLIDYAMAGDGEAGITGLIKIMKEHKGIPQAGEVKDVPGLIYRDGENIKTNNRCFPELDDLPAVDWMIQDPRWFREKGENRVRAYVDDSRGCPNQCSYCKCSLINGPKPRHRNIAFLQQTIDELVKKYGVRHITFAGNPFMSDAGYVENLCSWILENKLSLRWNCTGSAYVENFNDKNLLSLMHKAGCEQIHFGVESGNPDVRKRLHQTTPLKVFSELIPMVVDAGIFASGYFMFGLPEETVQEMDDTIRYAMSVPFTHRYFVTCLPFPGTSHYDIVLEKYHINHIDWGTYDFANPPMLPSKASTNEIKRKLFSLKLINKFTFLTPFYKRIKGISG